MREGGPGDRLSPLTTEESSLGSRGRLTAEIQGPKMPGHIRGLFAALCCAAQEERFMANLRPSDVNRGRARRSSWAWVLVLAGTLGFAASAPAQQNAAWPKARTADVRSVNAIVLATYDAISSTGSHGPDLQRFQSLFTPEARLIDVSYRNGKPVMVVRTIQEFVDAVAKLGPRPGRYEHEIARRTETYGNMVQVWSTNKYGSVGEAKPAGYGINSITLSWDGTRWWIIATTWKNQSPGQLVPAKYMPRKK